MQSCAIQVIPQFILSLLVICICKHTHIDLTVPIPVLNSSITASDASKLLPQSHNQVIPFPVTVIMQLAILVLQIQIHVIILRLS